MLERLLAAQRAAKLSNEQVANHVGRSRQWWEGVLAGRWDVPLDLAVPLAALLGLPLASIPWKTEVRNPASEGGR